MISEYVVANYGAFPHILAQPVGAVDEKLQASVGYSKALGLSRPFRPEVDAVVILPKYLLIIEAKVWNVVNGLAKLPIYKSLVPITPELQQFMPREILMELVVGWSNANLQKMASDAGVSVKVYTPDWLQGVVDKMHVYWTAEYRDQRAQKLKLREYYGIQ